MKHIARLLTLTTFCLLLQPAALHAQYSFGINNGKATITGYAGSGGDVIIPDTIEGYPVAAIGSSVFWFKAEVTSVTIPNSVTSIGLNAFSYSGITKATIGSGVTTIGLQAFDLCFSLTNITVDGSNPSFASAGGVLFNKAMNTLLQYPGGTPGGYEIPSSVFSIGSYAFYDCTGLTSVTIGDSVRSLGADAFYGCNALTNVTIGNSVRTIPFEAFSYCSSLPSVTIPGSITNIGTYAFAYCGGLRQAYFQGNAPRINNGAGSTDTTVFRGDGGTVFYLPGMTGWGASFGGWPIWAGSYEPQPQLLGYGFGAQSNGFSFTISWLTNTAVVVEGSANLQNWLPVTTNSLVNGTNFFSDKQWTNYPRRFYRLRSQ